MPLEMLENRRFKSYTPTSFKTVGQDGLKEGEYVATASVFDVIDSYGDRVLAGAFANTLAAWASKGDPIPVIWAHQWTNPMAHIGQVLDIDETGTDLRYKAALDLDDPFAMKVYQLMKGRRITQQSFGFDVVEGGWATFESREVFEIAEVDLYEVGPCLVGVNQSTDLLGIKSSSGAPILVAPTPRGQAESKAAGVPSEESGSDPKTPASNGLSPASIKLLAEFELGVTD
jgi:HK97 family phage prohead protease